MPYSIGRQAPNYANLHYVTDTPVDRVRLRALREAKGWSQARLAREAGVHQTVVNRVEKGTAQNPRIESIRLIAKALGVHVEALAPGVSDPVTAPDQTYTTVAESGTLAPHLAEEVARYVVSEIAPLLPRLPPALQSFEETAPYADPFLTVDVEDAVAAGELGRTNGQSGLGERKLWWRVRITGHCMEPAIRDGDYVIVEKAHAEVGETVVVVLGDQVICKRLAMHDGELVLVAEDGTEVRPDEDGIILGVVRFVPMPRRSAIVRVHAS